MVGSSSRSLLAVVGTGPERVLSRAARKLVKGLSQELRTGASETYALTRSATFENRRDAAVGLELSGTAEAASIRTEGSQQARRQSRSGTGQQREQRVVFMAVDDRLDLLVYPNDSFPQHPQQLEQRGDERHAPAATAGS